MSDSSPRFLADRMLGRLTTWLRIMGADCAYAPEGEDQAIVEMGLEEERILLTRDRGILERKRLPRLLFVESEHLERQLVQVLTEFSIDPLADAFKRCVRCNVLLTEASFEEAGTRIPAHIHATQARIAKCPACRRFFWGGTHQEKMKRRLEEIRRAATRPLNQDKDKGTS